MQECKTIILATQKKICLNVGNVQDKLYCNCEKCLETVTKKYKH